MPGNAAAEAASAAAWNVHFPFRHHAERQGRSGRTRTDPPFGAVGGSSTITGPGMQIRLLCAGHRDGAAGACALVEVALQGRREQMVVEGDLFVGV